jgi:hypothetical protein
MRSCNHAVALATPLFVVCLILALAGGSGCEITVPADGNTNENSSPEQPLPDQGVLLRLANLTDLAVETGIHISSNGAAATTETLFVPELLVTEGVGLAATGVMAPQTTDVVNLDCGTDMVVGTTGGLFRDVETGEMIGSGTPRILQEGLVFDCGATITLVYREEESAFSVTVTLE